MIFLAPMPGSFKSRDPPPSCAASSEAVAADLLQERAPSIPGVIFFGKGFPAPGICSPLSMPALHEVIDRFLFFG
jgi:hypothetical protein